MKETIPKKWIDLAKQPVDSPHWKTLEKDGEEYFYHADGNWLVINEKVGSCRLRSICKIIRTVKVNPI